MTQYYRLANSAVSGMSVDGIEHTVNPDTGLLEVEVMTPNLSHELRQAKAELVDPNAPVPLSPAEQAEREGLFVELDQLTGRKVDRRKSLQQLRALKTDLSAAKTKAP